MHIQATDTGLRKQYVIPAPQQTHQICCCEINTTQVCMQMLLVVYIDNGHNGQWPLHTQTTQYTCHEYISVHTPCSFAVQHCVACTVARMCNIQLAIMLAFICRDTHSRDTQVNHIKKRKNQTTHAVCCFIKRASGAPWCRSYPYGGPVMWLARIFSCAAGRTAPSVPKTYVYCFSKPYVCCSCRRSAFSTHPIQLPPRVLVPPRKVQVP